VAVAPLVDADDGAGAGELVALLAEAVVELMQAAVQEDDRPAASIDLDVQARATHLDEFLARRRLAGGRCDQRSHQQAPEGHRDERGERARAGHGVRTREVDEALCRDRRLGRH
jgi:hypothetical protein